MKRKPRRFKPVKAGEWVQPVTKGYLMKCCDCGLVHRMNFRLQKDRQNGFHIQLQAFRVKGKP